MLRTVTKISTILITRYAWYHRYREIIQITGGPPLRLHPMPDSKTGRRKVKCSNVTWARSTQSSHRHQLVFSVLLALSLMIPVFFIRTIGIIFILYEFFWLKLIWLCVIHGVQDYCVLFWNYSWLTLVYLLFYGVYRLLVKLLGSSDLNIQELPVSV